MAQIYRSQKIAKHLSWYFTKSSHKRNINLHQNWRNIFYAYADLQKVLEKNKVEATPNLFNPKWLVR